MNEWIIGKILKINRWSSTLFSLILDAAINPFQAGQFTRLALSDNNNDKKKIQRAYSYVNSPNDKNIEIYIVRVLNGKLSNLLYNLNTGDEIFIKKKSYGFFVLNEIPSCKILWMFATGTGIGPYLSILQEGKEITKFHTIVLTHAVRYYRELNYLPLMKKLYSQYNGKLKIQIILSREKKNTCLLGRIPSLLENQLLEKTVGFKMDAQTSHVMLCGNPNMIKDTYSFLKNKKNMIKHSRRVKGNITMENYW